MGIICLKNREGRESLDLFCLTLGRMFFVFGDFRNDCEEIDPREEEFPRIIRTLDADSNEFFQTDPVSDLMNVFRIRRI